MAANILVLVSFTSATGADQPRTLSVQEPKVIKLAEQPQNTRVYDLAISPRRDSPICAFSLAHAVQLWDLSAGPAMIATLTPPGRRGSKITRFDPYLPHPVAFSHDGARLATGYSGIQIWDFEHRKILFAYPWFLWQTEAFRFSARDRSLIVGCSWRGLLSVQGDPPGKLQILPRSEYERVPVADPANFEMDLSLLGEDRNIVDLHEETDIYCLAVSQDGNRLFAGGGPVLTNRPAEDAREASVTVWDVAKSRRMLAIGGKEAPVLRFCLSPNGAALYTCGNKVLGWDATKSAAPIQEFDASGRRMVSVAVSPDGTMLAAGGRDGAVVIWDVDTTTRLATLAHKGGPVYGLAFSHAPTKLVAAGEGGIASVWHIDIPPKKQK